MSYKAEFSKKAKAALDSESQKNRLIILKKIKLLMESPKQYGIKLRGFKSLWRARAGRFRVIYRIEDERICILILRIAKRDESTYVGLDDLN